MRIAMIVALASLTSAPVFAQTVINPTKVEYTVSADHTQLTKYTIGYFLPGATDPVQTADLPLATPDAQQKVTEPINALPLGFGTYTAKLKSVAGTVSGDWSAASNEFVRAPFPPGSVLVKK